MISIKGKWAFVTGASRGIGKQISLNLARLGCNLIIHSRKKQHNNELINILNENNIESVAVEAEFLNKNELEKMLDEIKRLNIKIDILYNNAAIMTPFRQDPWKIPAEDFRKCFEVNVIAMAQICYAFVPDMIKRKWGRIINVTSGIQKQPELTTYAISKAAVDKFVRDFGPILNNTGVAMNLLDPGWLKTDLGGPNAPNPVDDVIPGALVPALIPEPLNGHLFCALDYQGMTIPEAVKKTTVEIFQKNQV